MYKTFYSVRYSVWGADKPRTKWFNNKEEAKKFSQKDYSDDYVTHKYSKPESIEEIETIIAMQNIEF